MIQGWRKSIDHKTKQKKNKWETRNIFKKIYVFKVDRTFGLIRNPLAK